MYCTRQKDLPRPFQKQLATSITNSRCCSVCVCERLPLFPRRRNARCPPLSRQQHMPLLGRGSQLWLHFVRQLSSGPLDRVPTCNTGGLERNILPGKYHKGAIAPLYIGMARVGQHHSHTFEKSMFPWQ